MVGCFCISKNGHDTGEYYVIVPAAGNKHSTGENFVWVANGKNRTVANPKKKNKAHLFITKTQVSGMDRILDGEPVSSNLKLANLIKQYRAQNTVKGV